MTKNEFLKILENGLKDFPQEELQDILYDYKEHFYNGEREGKTEEEIINELGDPYVIVNQYRSGYVSSSTNSKEYSSNRNNARNNNINTNNNGDNTATKITKLIIFILAIIVLTPVIFGGGVGVLGVLFAIISIPFAFSIGGIGLLISKLGINFIGISLPPVISDFPTSVIVLITIGSIAGTILFIILGIYLIKLIIIGIRKLISLIN